MKNPNSLLLETNTTCNAKCIMCYFNDIDRKNKNMHIDDAKKIIRDACNELKVKNVSLHLYGEPTLYPRFSELSYWVRDNFNVGLLLTTNASKLINQKLRKTALDCYKQVVISLDGYKNETLKKIRPGLNPNDVRRGVKLLYEERVSKKPRIIINTVILDDNVDEIEESTKYWKQYSDGVSTHNVVRFKNGKRCVVDGALRENKPCDRPFMHLTVDVDGDVLICCQDATATEIVGNVFETSIKDVWMSKRFQELRKMHIEGESNKIPVCAGCQRKVYYDVDEWSQQLLLN